MKVTKAKVEREAKRLFGEKAVSVYSESWPGGFCAMVRDERAGWRNGWTFLATATAPTAAEAWAKVLGALFKLKGT